MPKVIEFYKVRDEYGFLSNFAPYPIYLKGKLWPTSEHYFQAQKFIDTEHEELIRLAKSPAKAASMGREPNRPLRPDWETVIENFGLIDELVPEFILVKDTVMFDALWAKFTQHLELAQRLIETENAILVEHTKNDSYWGDGGDGSGKNTLGLLLMLIRKRLSSLNEWLPFINN